MNLYIWIANFETDNDRARFFVRSLFSDNLYVAFCGQEVTKHVFTKPRRTCLRALRPEWAQHTHFETANHLFFIHSKTLLFPSVGMEQSPGQVIQEIDSKWDKTWFENAGYVLFRGKPQHELSQIAETHNWASPLMHVKVLESSFSTDIAGAQAKDLLELRRLAEIGDWDGFDEYPLNVQPKRNQVLTDNLSALGILLEGYMAIWKREVVFGPDYDYNFVFRDFPTLRDQQKVLASSYETPDQQRLFRQFVPDRKQSSQEDDSYWFDECQFSVASEESRSWPQLVKTLPELERFQHLGQLYQFLRTECFGKQDDASTQPWPRDQTDAAGRLEMAYKDFVVFRDSV